MVEIQVQPLGYQPIHHDSRFKATQHAQIQKLGEYDEAGNWLSRLLGTTPKGWLNFKYGVGVQNFIEVNSTFGRAELKQHFAFNGEDVLVGVYTTKHLDVGGGDLRMVQRVELKRDESGKMVKVSESLPDDRLLRNWRRRYTETVRGVEHRFKPTAKVE